MHYFQSMIAEDIADERIREAARQRLADEARRSQGQPRIAARLGVRLALFTDRLRFGPPTSTDAPDCA
jgi:hypothetical protein